MTSNKKNIRLTKTIIIIIALLLSSVAIIKWYKGGSRTEASNLLTFKARQGDLIISITESGTIQAQDKIVIKNEIEGSTTILWIIDEGSMVKKGDLLVEMDASELEDKRFLQQIKVQNAEATFRRAKEDLDITKNQADSDIEKAETTLSFAEQDLEKYTKGEYPQQLQEAEVRITLAREEQHRADEKLKWSNVLFKQKLISQTELQADELAAKKTALDLKLAEGKKELLEKYTNKREMASLESDIKQAKMALERTRRKAKANILQTEIDVAAKEAEFKRQSDKLKKINNQIKAAHVYAPSQGLVLYATSVGRAHRKREPLAAGVSIYEKQDMIFLPDTSKMMASIKIHETNVKKTKVDMPARIKVDALPGKIFRGHVNQIAPLPDPASFWSNPDLKVYNTDIYIDDITQNLRDGMTCEVEITADVFTNAVYVPIQSVIRIQSVPKVYVRDKHGIVTERTVEIGEDNGRMIHITKNLQAGEEVLLTPPLAKSERPDHNKQPPPAAQPEGAHD
jgi:HlyD family secretion protein